MDTKIFISSRFGEFESLRKKIAKSSFEELSFDKELIMLDTRVGADPRSPDIASIQGASDSDIFILLLGESYKEPLDDEKSYTHKEYDAALKKGLKIFAFPIGDCYCEPRELSSNKIFRQFQESVLENNHHITDDAQLTDIDIDQMYSIISTALRNYNSDIIYNHHQKTHDPHLSTNQGVDDSFIGRVKELDAMREKLESNSLLLVHGIGGIGKSSIAKAYYRKYREAFHYYGYFEGLQSFKKDLKSKLNVSKTKELIFKLQALQGSKLIIIDDIKEEEDDKLLRSLLELRECGYTILLTSRQMLRDMPHYSIDVLDIDDAKSLFESISIVEDRATLEAILSYVDYHPFSIEMTAKTLETHDVLTAQMVREKFENGAFSKVKVDRYHTFNDYLNDLYSFVELNDEDILLLKRLSILPSIDISFTNLTIFLNQKTQEQKEELEEILNDLNDEAWIKRTKIAHTSHYKLHQILIEYIWANHTPVTEEIDNIVLLFANIVANSTEVRSVKLLREYIVYFEAINKTLERLHIFNDKVTQYFDNMARIYENIGEYQKAEPFYLKVLQIREHLYGENHRDTATSYNNLGTLYYSMGVYKKAEPLSLKALEIHKKLLGEEHPDTASSYNNLAELYRSMGVYEKAEPLYLKALDIWKRVLGEEHPDTQTGYKNLELFRKAMQDEVNKREK